MNSDLELLRQFADEGSQEAFAELVRRTVNFVYAAALRQTAGDAHLAQDVTQGVYFALASRAAELKRHAALTGWLYTTTRFVAIRTVRTQARWQRREQEANSMNTLLREADPAWETLRPVIDEALHELGEKDRTALLLRFFEGRSLAEVGAAIGLNENSARMRVERALEKLHEQLTRRGVTSTAAALGLILANQPAVAAPAGFASAITGPALAGATAGAAAVPPLAGMMGATKIALGAMSAAALLGAGAYLGGRFLDPSREAALAALHAENQALAADAQEWRTAHVGQGVAGQSDSQRLNEVADDVVQKRARQKASVVAVAPAAGGLGANRAMAASTSEDLRVLTDLQTRKLVRPDVTFVNNNGTLTKAFGELFALTPTEQTTLQQAVERARDRLTELERANAIVTHDAKGNVTIAVSSFAGEGGRVYDDLMKTFADTLGRERNAAFQALGAAQVERALGHFGAGERTLVFSFDPAAVENQPYAIVEQHKLPFESGSASRSFKTLAEAMDWAGTAGRLVPPGFGR